MQGEMKTATISRTPTGKYYISIIVENDLEYPEKQEFSHATMIGVDVGSITFATLSTGEKIDHPKFLKSSIAKIKMSSKKSFKKSDRIEKPKKSSKTSIKNTRINFKST